jgi:signal transduction histidine kinase
MSDQPATQDNRIPLYIQVAEQMQQGNYDVELPVTPPDQVGRLGEALQKLAQTLQTHYDGLYKLDQITMRINAGLLLDDILDSIYEDFRDVIPYNRIGCSLIEKGSVVRAHWARTDRPQIRLEKGYTAELKGSSLQTIIETGTPRILNDLEAYLREHPDSESTRLIVEEGIRSSLTCPLIANGVPVGFIFFSSVEPHTYTGVHIDIFRRIARKLSVIVEKGRLVSELTAQKAAFEEQNRELLRLNELKDTFLGVAAHDLRNPIAIIEMGVSILQNPEMHLSENEYADILRDMGNQTRHMAALIDELLDMSQIESGKLELYLETISLKDFIDEAVRRHTRLAAQKDTQVLLVEAAEGTVLADRSRLRQVIDNLLSNAVKYSPMGSTVRVRVERVPPGWRVSVEDEGPGIDPQDRERLFQYFSRLSAQPTAGEKSTGLGLAITRRVVEAHGGQIGVDSGPGGGATFWFTLPDEAA